MKPTTNELKKGNAHKIGSFRLMSNIWLLQDHNSVVSLALDGTTTVPHWYNDTEQANMCAI